MPSNEATPSRRPLKTRQKQWPKALAGRLARAGATPNGISLTSLLFAFGSAACLVAAPLAGRAVHVALLISAAGLIQLRLLCNLLDGLVAVEGGMRTPTGEIYNDAPDRFADMAILAGAGYGIRSIAWGIDLGWAAAATAVVVAYVRYLGAAMGSPQFFIGPMAKQQRMALMTVACLAAAAETVIGLPDRAIPVALGIVVVGGIVTIWRRIRAISRAVNG
jgi:phosphatidylglycerophosphate synthase